MLLDEGSNARAVVCFRDDLRLNLMPTRTNVSQGVGLSVPSDVHGVSDP